VGGTVPVNMAEAGACGSPITFTLTLDGTQVFTTSGATTSATFNWNTAGADGAHTLVLTVRDGTGSTVSAIRHVTVSNVIPGPKPLISTPAEGATVSGIVTVGMDRADTGGGTITWTLKIDGITVFTATSAASTQTYSWDTSAWAVGPHTLSLTVQDPGSGSLATSAPRHVTLAGPLTASITSPTEGATVSGAVPVGMSESGGTGTISWTLRLDGSSTPIFSTSNAAPTASFTWDTSTVTPGSHRLDLTVQDGGGRTATATRNVTVQSIGTIKVFITQPGTDGTTITAGSTVWFTIWLENASGSRTLTLSMDGVAVGNTTSTSNGPISMPWSSSGASGGTHTATVSVRDSVNNTGNANRTIVVPGPAKLTASINTPVEGATVSGMVTVGMSETNGTGTINWTLQLDGGSTPIFSTSNSGSTASFTWDTTNVATGSHTLTLTVQDGGGQTATATRNVTVNIPPPLTVRLLTPAADATVGGVVSVSVSTSGGSGTLSLTVSVDDPRRPPPGTVVLFTNSGPAGTFTFNWDTAVTVADGPHTLTATVQDGSGSTTTATRRVTVRQAPPPTIRVFITQPGGDGATVSGTTWFTIWIENAAAGNKTFTMSLDGTAVGTPTNTTSNGPVSMPWTTNGTPNGSHSVTISVRDSANGTGQSVRVVNVAN